MHSRLSVASLLLLGCSPDWELPRDERPAASIAIEPFGSLEQAPEVLRLRVAGVLGRTELADFRLFQGELSDYHLGRVRARELPQTLLEREVPAVVWPEPPELVVAPAAILGPGRHSLAASGLGLIAAFDVVPTGNPQLERFWPPRERSSGGGLSLFAADATSIAEETILLSPAGVSARLAPGLDESGAFAERVLRIAPEPAAELPDGALVLPPLAAAGSWFEPLPFELRATRTALPVCEPHELALGPACAFVDDDRVVLRAPETPALFALDQPERLLAVAAPGASLSVRGLEPGKPARLAGSAFAVSGERFAVDLAIHAAPGRAHLVINEVLANPAGDEGRSEWVELVNDGTQAVELDGYALVDTGGSFPLPPARLAPGELALLVGPDFDPDPELDVAVPREVRVLALPALGKAGLSNGGELLRLFAPDGSVVSRWPALAAPGPGQSLARRAPDAADTEAASFAPHAPPGASPGAPNALSSR
jgi:hypothetical protein